MLLLLCLLRLLAAYSQQWLQQLVITASKLRIESIELKKVKLTILYKSPKTQLQESRAFKLKYTVWEIFLNNYIYEVDIPKWWPHVETITNIDPFLIVAADTTKKYCWSKDIFRPLMRMV